MNKNKITFPSDAPNTYAPQGANDARWFLFEHQLEQAKISLHAVVGTLKVIAERPENEGEREAAGDCLETCEELFVGFLGYRSTLLSYLSGTDVPERIQRKEACSHD